MFSCTAIGALSFSLSFRPLQAPKEALAQSVLAEVPNQLVSYFKMLKLDPVNIPALKA